MSQSLAPLPMTQPPALFPLTPPDGGGDGLSAHSDAFANTLEAAQNSLRTGDGDNPYDGSGLDGPASMEGGILGKLSSLSEADDAQRSKLMAPFERASGAPTLSADGTESDSNVIGAADQVGQTLSRTSPREGLKQIMQTTIGMAQNALWKQLGITAAGKVSETVSKLVQQQ
jgi:hypothetical protein